MKQKIVSFLMLLAFCIGLFPCVAQAATVGERSAGTTPDVTTLLEDVRSEEGFQIAPIGGGRFLAAFVGSDGDAKYSIFEGSKWREPGSLMGPDDTPDSISAGPVSINTLGNGQLFLSWCERSMSSAENGQAQYLNSQNSVGRFFDRASIQFGGLVMTTETTDGDVVADSNLQLAYDYNTGHMICYYTKSLYEIDPQSGEPVCTASQKIRWGLVACLWISDLRGISRPVHLHLFARFMV